MLKNILVVGSHPRDYLARASSFSEAFVVLLILTSRLDATVTTKTGTLKYLNDIDSYLGLQGLKLGAGLVEDTDGDHNDQSTSMEGQMAQLGEALRKISHELESFIAKDQREETSMSSKQGLIYWKHSLDSQWMDPRRRLAVIKSILASLDDCGQMSPELIYAASAKNQNVLGKLARYRAEACWKELTSSVSHRIDEAIGEEDKQLFSNIELLTETYPFVDFKPTSDQLLEEAPPRPLVFDQANPESQEFQSMLKSLKGIDLTANQKMWDFLHAIKELASIDRGEANFHTDRKTRARHVEEFYGSFFLTPCRSLTTRIGSIMTEGNRYRHIKLKLDSVLAQEAIINLRLDYELQIYRICKQALGMEKKIITSLKKHYQ